MPEREKRETIIGVEKAGDTLVSALSSQRRTMSYLREEARVVIRIDRTPGQAHDQTVVSNGRINDVLSGAVHSAADYDHRQNKPTLPTGMGPKPGESRQPPSIDAPSVLDGNWSKPELRDKVMMIFELFTKDKGLFAGCQEYMDWLSKVFVTITPVKFLISEGEIILDREDLLEVIGRHSESNTVLITKVVKAILTHSKVANAILTHLANS